MNTAWKWLLIGISVFLVAFFFALPFFAGSGSMMGGGWSGWSMMGGGYPMMGVGVLYMIGLVVVLVAVVVLAAVAVIMLVQKAGTTNSPAALNPSICAHCGKNVQQGWVACPHCGNKL